MVLRVDVEGRPPLYAILCTSSCICVYRSGSNTLRAQLAYELLALWRLGTQGDHFLPKSNYRHMKRGSPSFVYAIWFIFTRRRWSTWWSLVNDRMLNLRTYGRVKIGCDAKIDFFPRRKKNSPIDYDARLMAQTEVPSIQTSMRISNVICSNINLYWKDWWFGEIIASFLSIAEESFVNQLEKKGRDDERARGQERRTVVH